jgi:hypothetical protein
MQEKNGQHTTNLIITHTYKINDELVEKNILIIIYLFVNIYLNKKIILHLLII